MNASYSVLSFLLVILIISLLASSGVADQLGTVSLDLPPADWL